MSLVPREFIEKYAKWSEYMIGSGLLLQSDIDEFKVAIRTDTEDGPDQLRDHPYTIDTREERMKLWSDYFDWWLPPYNGINERIRTSIKETRP